MALYLYMLNGRTTSGTLTAGVCATYLAGYISMDSCSEAVYCLCANVGV